MNDCGGLVRITICVEVWPLCPTISLPTWSKRDGARRGHAGFHERASAHRPGARPSLPADAEERAEYRVRAEIGVQPLFGFDERLAHGIVGERIGRLHVAAGRSQRQS